MVKPILQLYVAAILFSLGTLYLHAQDTRTVTEPVFPPVCTQLTAQLAAGPLGLPASSETLLDTSRIQTAMNACPVGQAVELQASGDNNAYLIGPLQLPKGVTLLVDPGVTVFASRNPRDYDANSSKSCGTLAVVTTGCSPIITANRADGAGIMGYGTIDGRGYLPMLINGAPSSQRWWDLARSAVSPLGQNNPRMLQVSNSSNFTLYKITLKNSPNFHVAMGTDTNFTAWGVKIITPYDARNTDGIDPGYSSNVTITHCYISEGDDNVAIGGANSPGASNISVVNNFFGDGHGASIGSYTQAGVSNVLFDHITIAGDTANSNAIGIRIKSDISRGGLVQNITYSNICMRSVRSAIVLDPFYTAGATGTLIPQYKNISLQNVHATTEGTVAIQGHDAAVPTTITLDNVQIDGIKSSDLTESNVSYALGPDPVNFASLIKGAGVTIANNVSTSNPPYACPAAAFSPIAGELIPGPPQIPAGQPFNVAVQVFTTKATPYQAYLTNLKTNPNATLSLPAPTGTVTLYDGPTAVATGTLTGTPLLTLPITGLTPGAHTLTAAYSGDANYAAITFGSYAVTIGNIAVAAVVNAASFAPNLIAQGSLFSIFGTNLGPIQPVQAASFPLLATLGGVSVQVLQSGKSYDAWLLYAGQGQINALLPSNVPVGRATVTVTYAGQTSPPASFAVVQTAFGVFTITLDQPGIAVVWGTGLGAINAPDNLPPGDAAVDMTNLPVRIMVGGVPAQRIYAGRQSQFAGVDNVYFKIPDGTPSGCQVLVTITVAGATANTTSLCNGS